MRRIPPRGHHLMKRRCRSGCRRAARLIWPPLQRPYRVARRLKRSGADVELWAAIHSANAYYNFIFFDRRLLKRGRTERLDAQ